MSNPGNTSRAVVVLNTLQHKQKQQWGSVAIKNEVRNIFAEEMPQAPRDDAVFIGV